MLRFAPAILLLVLFVNVAIPQSSKIIGDCTITYAITIEDGTAQASKTLYIKGNKTRVDISNKAFTQSIIADHAEGSVVILKEVGNNKYMSTLDNQQWAAQNSKYDGMEITFTNETKTILNYPCKKAVAKLKNGSSFSVFYAVGIAPSTTENPYQFKKIPGLVLQFDGEGETRKVSYIATRVDLSPVPVSKFEIPAKGYRTL